MAVYWQVVPDLEKQRGDIDQLARLQAGSCTATRFTDVYVYTKSYAICWRFSPHGHFSGWTDLFRDQLSPAALPAGSDPNFFNEVFLSVVLIYFIVYVDMPQPFLSRRLRSVLYSCDM